VRKPWLTLSVTEAVLFREIDKSQPTLLLDESDALFKKGGGNDDRREPIRALLNAGFKRGAMVPRCMGSGNFEVQHFKVFLRKSVCWHRNIAGHDRRSQLANSTHTQVAR